MLLNRVIKTATKADALLTIYFLITVAMMIGGSLAYNLAEGSILGIIITTLIGWVLCWDMVNAVVEAAITTETEKQVRQAIETYKEMNTPEGICQQQDLEFFAVVPPTNRKGDDSYALRLRHNDLGRIQEESVTREAIVRGLDVLTREAIVRGFNNKRDPLRALAIMGACHALGKTHLSDEALDKDTEFKILFYDIYIYLKAWLMLSIKNRREMDLERIVQRYPSIEAPNTKVYTKALRYIRNNSLEIEQLRGYIADDFIENARDMLRNYLERLIEGLDKNRNKK
ncbi:MAG: hypothetical protein DCF22_10950 [Leptolyngbya sp.]|nr:MAG: hypothetical protein DCF22_10950 [Leptolyngbya sp.]